MAATVATLSVVPAERAAVAPALTIDPAGDLVDGQTVEVSGEGAFGETVQILQCTADPTGWGDCDGDTSRFLSPEDGSIAVSQQVFALIVTGSSGGQVDCRSAGSCVLTVLPEADQWDGATSVPLAFAPDGPLLPPPPRSELRFSCEPPPRADFRRGSACQNGPSLVLRRHRPPSRFAGTT